MALAKQFINAKITSIERDDRAGAGGDTNVISVIEEEICAIRQPFNAFASAGQTMDRGVDFLNFQADNTFWIDLRLAPKAIREVKVGDYVTWESLGQKQGGPTGTRHEVARINIWESPGLQREHVEIFTIGAAN